MDCDRIETIVWHQFFNVNLAIFQRRFFKYRTSLIVRFKQFNFMNSNTNWSWLKACYFVVWLLTAQKRNVINENTKEKKTKYGKESPGIKQMFWKGNRYCFEMLYDGWKWDTERNLCFITRYIEHLYGFWCEIYLICNSSIPQNLDIGWDDDHSNVMSIYVWFSSANIRENS